MRAVAKASTGALLACAAWAWVFAPSAAADSWSHNYSVAAHAQLHFHTNDGSIEVTAGSGNQIAARVETAGWAIKPNEVTISEHQSGDAVDINVHVPQGNTPWFGGRRRYSVHVYLQVPAQADLDLETGDGSVEARDITGNIRLDSGDGHIRVENLRGQLRIHSGDGHIEGFGLDGTVEARTSDGSLQLRGRFDRVYADTGDGSIEVAVENGSKMAGPWELRTSDGRVHVRLPDAFNALLDAHTGDGRVNVEGISVTVSGSLQSGSLRGKINNGGESLTIRSGDGSIYIERI